MKIRAILPAIFISLASVTLILIVTLSADAQISTQNLPEGIRSPSVRFGNISQLSQQYNGSGHLNNSVDLRSVEFNAKKLSVLEPKIEALVGLFNRMGRYDLGSQINKGTLWREQSLDFGSWRSGDSLQKRHSTFKIKF